MVAFRIIIYLESDISRIEISLRKYFEVDEVKSVDKRLRNNPHEVGYRSLHLICKLGISRGKLPEHEGLENFLFEIQVRTVLEHAWAEIEHKKNYKSAVALPPNLQRKLNIISGTLELVDSQLAAIAEEALAYSEKVVANSDEVSSDPISDASLLALSRSFSEETALNLRVSDSDRNFSELIQELERFGITKVSDLSQLLQKQSEKIHLSNPDGTTIFGLVRDALLFEDYKKYLKDCYTSQFAFYYDDLTMMAEVMGEPNLLDYCDELGVVVEKDDSTDFLPI